MIIAVFTKRFSLYILFSFLFSYLLADPTPSNNERAPVERLINEIVYAYNIDEKNLTRLAAYTELKGVYTRETGHLQVHFGSYGTLQFFKASCLLKTYDGYYTLSPEEQDTSKLFSFNRALFNLLESIPLLSNQYASPNHVAFVDRCLSRKSLAAFDKLYVRHILIKYGKFDQGQVSFQDNWLPEHIFVEVDQDTRALKRKGSRRLKLTLTEKELRGYYLDIGAEVYARDANRKVIYASGEILPKNIGPLNLFVQHLYIQTAQFITKDKPEIGRMEKRDTPILAVAPKTNFSVTDHPGLQHRSLKEIKLNNHPYQMHSWIPTMLGLLRYHDIEFHDPDVANILISHPSFDVMLDFMTTEEQEMMFSLIQ